MPEELTKLLAEVKALKEAMKVTEGTEALDRKEVLARLENLDRSVQELQLTLQQAEESRKREWELVQKLLSEERAERREGALEVKVEQKERRSLIVGSVKAVWDKGGQWIVAAICLWVVLQMQTCSGVNLARLLKIGG